MKTSNKSTIITGVTLLLIAAFFTISLILQVLDLGYAEPDYNNVLYFLGNLLYSVYGFSSALIPLFLFIAGISCFSSKWNARKTMRLLTAIVPFFTAVVTESICRSILDLGYSDYAGVKIFVAVVTGLMLIIIELLGAGIIADKINPVLFGKKDEADGAAEKEVADGADEEIKISENGEIIDAEKEHPADHFDSIGKINTDGLIYGKTDDTENEDASANNASGEAAADVALTEAGSTSDANEGAENDGNAAVVEESAAEGEAVEKSPVDTEVQQAVSNVFEQALTEVKAENLKLEEEADAAAAGDSNPVIDGFVDASDAEDGADHDETYEEESVAFDDEVNQADGSVITEEEFAALTQFGDEDQPEELEWKNLPPQKNELPQDYQEEEIDENDPALEFPPKDEAEDEAAADNEDGIFSADGEPVKSGEEENGSSGIDDDFVPQVNSEIENPAVYSAENKTTLEEDPFSAFDVDSSADKKKAPIYEDSVVENPRFGHGITLREGEAPEAASEEKKTSEPVKSAFPSKIHLENGSADEYEEDPTLPFPDIRGEEPVYGVKHQTQSAPLFYSDEEDEVLNSHAVGASSFIPATFSEAPAADALPEESSASSATPSKEAIANAANNSSALYAASHSKNPDGASAKSVFGKNDSNGAFGPVSDVFSDMENDIRRESYKKLGEKTPEELAQLRSSDISDEDAAEGLEAGGEERTVANAAEMAAENQARAGKTEEKAAEAPESEEVQPENPSFLEDNIRMNEFYEKQNAENTPVTQEIAANPPRVGNRAHKKGPYVIPSDLLTAYKDDQYWVIDDATKESALNLTQTLAEFNIEAQVIGIKKGPVVTMFEILPAPGVRLQKIVALQDNIALSLAAQSIRIVAPIPGKQAVGIEVPNRHRSIVGFREIIEMKLAEWSKMAVPVILGKDILGKAQIIDLVKTPHMLIAGATGSGKSVCVNSLILSILYKRSFRDVKLILVDPKVVELKLYNNIPHLLTPVITEPKKALQALQWCLCEMERRYALLDSMGVRDISTYNERIKERDIATEKLPYIVVIIDEFADLMATSGRELESTVARLTAMSRAVGIHLVLATQRPSVNVITGLIKANIPSRIAFMVSSRTDSNIIIDSVGAEKLLGRGDMLYASAVDPAPVRIQGTFVSDQEVEDVVRTVKEYGEPDYIDDQMFFDDEESEGDNFELNGNYDEDPLYDQALEIVIQAGKASASYLQRRLSIGYNRAARLVEEMEERGIVGPANGSKPREIIHVPG